jgi:serine protease Do
MSDHSKISLPNLFLSFTTSVVASLMIIGLFLFVYLPVLEILDSSSEVSQVLSDEAEESTSEKDNSVSQEDELTIQIAIKTLPSIVGIRVTQFVDEPSSDITTEASGVIYTHNGYIITNQHVIERVLNDENQLIDQSIVEVFIEGNPIPHRASLRGFDQLTDLALLKIEASLLVPAKFGDSDDIEIGQTVIAFGSPGGLKYMGSVSKGIISGINREVEFGDGTMMQLLQTDAAVNPGNSGGALVNRKGEVIGINNAGFEKSQFEGINFAIPSNLVVDIIESIKNDGYVKGRVWMGVYVMNDSDYLGVKSLYGLPDGIFIQDVDQNGPAKKGGIQKNDILLEIDSIPVTSISELRKILNRYVPGDRVEALVYRPLADETLNFFVDLEERAP